MRLGFLLLLEARLCRVIKSAVSNEPISRERLAAVADELRLDFHPVLPQVVDAGAEAQAPELLEGREWRDSFPRLKVAQDGGGLGGVHGVTR